MQLAAVIELTLLVLGSLTLSLGLNRVMLVVAPKLGLMDQPGERRIHDAPIPRAGGIAIWISFLATVTLGLASGWLTVPDEASWRWLGAFTASSGVLIAAGVLDDRVGLPPLVKLGAHILAPVLMFLAYPIEIVVFPDDWSRAWEFGFFIVWTVVLINAFNLIDGLDGLCGGLAAVAVFALAGLAFANGRNEAIALLLIMGGTLLGFLKFNYNPARIFLGDAGSMLLGFFLATTATEAVGRKAVLGVILLPIAIAGVPLVDVLLAIWRRSAANQLAKLHGEKPTGGVFSADRLHLHHKLLAIGGSQRRVATILHAIAIVLTILAFMPLLFGNQMFGFSLVGILIVLLVGIRNLAQVEMERTGNMVHMAIKLPGHRRRLALAIFVYDFFVLVIAGIAAVLIETNLMTRGADSPYLLRFAILFAILGSIALLVIGVHQRLWARATMRNLLSLQAWLLIASVATFSCFSLLYSSMEWAALRVTIISYVIAAIGVSIPRACLDLLRELGLEARHCRRNGKAKEKDREGAKERPATERSVGGYGNAAVLGSGDLGTLFLDHLKSSDQSFYPGLRVIGFLDESKVLWGRHLRSFRILGGLESIPNLVRTDELNAIVVAIHNPRPELIERLDSIAKENGIQIYRWCVGLESWTPPEGSGQR